VIPGYLLLAAKRVTFFEQAIIGFSSPFLFPAAVLIFQPQELPRQDLTASSMEMAYGLLNDVFGYKEFRGAQAAIIEHIIQGGDALVLMPTGGGKSLCYQIPGLVRPGIACVISPLIALMQNQVEALTQAGIRAAFLNSSQSIQELQQVELKLRQGEIDLLYVAPERLLTSRFLDLLRNIPLALFAIDEAHCVSQWGHDFRPEYQRLSVLHEHFPQVPRIALTATADILTRGEIISQLKLEDAKIFIAGFDRPNIRYHVVEKNQNKRQLTDLLDEKELRGQSGIVYCLSRRKVENTAAWLSEAGYKALPYHAGMEQEARRSNQQRFLREDGVIMVATVAFGMGIDKPDVRFVAHLDLPQSLEAYYQETGRAGRDGEPAVAWMTYSLGDVVQMHQRISQSEAPESQRRVMQQKLEAMLGYCETVQCRRAVLLQYFGDECKACGNCDICRQPPATWDGTVATQKLLSAAIRTGQRYGAGYLKDVLLGKTNARIEQNGHDKLPTFGIGKELSEREWNSVLRQVIAAGLLFSDAAKYGALQLTDKARPILKGEIVVPLRRFQERARKRRREELTEQTAETPVDQRLYEELRICRKTLADAQNVPAFVIFHDSTLREMAQVMPETPDVMRTISGIGERKLERYGRIFIEVIRKYKT